MTDVVEEVREEAAGEPRAAPQPGARARGEREKDLAADRDALSVY